MSSFQYYSAIFGFQSDYLSLFFFCRPRRLIKMQYHLSKSVLRAQLGGNGYNEHNKKNETAATQTTHTYVYTLYLPKNGKYWILNWVSNILRALGKKQLNLAHRSINLTVEYSLVKHFFHREFYCLNISFRNSRIKKMWFVRLFHRTWCSWFYLKPFIYANLLNSMSVFFWR